MRELLFILCVCFSLSVFSYEDVMQARPSHYGSSKNVKCPIQLVPGVGIGPLQVGRSLKEAEGFGMEIKTVQGKRTHMIIGKYSVGVTEQGVLRYVEAEVGDLPNCLYIDKKKITKNMTAEQIAKILPGCKSEQVLRGGKVIECDGVSIVTGSWGGRQKTPVLYIGTK